MSRDTKTSRCDMRASPTREGGQRAKSINIEYGAYFIILLRKDGCVRTPAERASPSRPTRRRSDCNALVIDQVIGESDGGIREREREREREKMASAKIHYHSGQESATIFTTHICVLSS